MCPMQPLPLTAIPLPGVSNAFVYKVVARWPKGRVNSLKGPTSASVCGLGWRGSSRCGNISDSGRQGGVGQAHFCLTDPGTSLDFRNLQRQPPQFRVPRELFFVLGDGVLLCVFVRQNCTSKQPIFCRPVNCQTSCLLREPFSPPSVVSRLVSAQEGSPGSTSCFCLEEELLPKVNGWPCNDVV